MMKIVVALFVLLMVPGSSLSATRQQREEVHRFLQTRESWYESHKSNAPDASQLRHLGKTALHLLARYLRNQDRSAYNAADVMLELDPKAAAPLLFQSVPRSNPEAQSLFFHFYIGYVLREKPFAHRRAMHQAALRYLNIDIRSDIAVDAILAIGLTGNRRDFPLLARCLAKNPSLHKRTLIDDAAQASLARLGSKRHLDAIAHQLRVPIPAERTFEWAENLSISIRKAAFSKNKRFVPLLRRHLKTPTPESKVDTVPQSPSYEAALALKILTKGTFSRNWSFENT